eukprot:6202293-Pleurochrysis_carterae.AAC.6
MAAASTEGGAAASDSSNASTRGNDVSTISYSGARSCKAKNQGANSTWNMRAVHKHGSWWRSAQIRTSVD